MEVKLGRRIHVPLLMMLNCGGTFMEFIERNEVKMETGMFLDEDFPFYISYKQISDYRDSEVLSHWHIELEYILVLEGRLDYIGEDSEYTMSEGEGVLVNGNVLHSYRRNRTNECRYLVVIFHPSLIGYIFLETRHLRIFVLPGGNCGTVKLPRFCWRQNHILRPGQRGMRWIYRYCFSNAGGFCMKKYYAPEKADLGKILRMS